MKKIYNAFLAMCTLACTNASAQSCMYSNASTTADLAVMKTAGFSDMIVALWSVQPNGDITWGSNTICSGGNYTMGNTIPGYAADMNALKQAPSCIKRLEAGIGGWGNGTFSNIRDLINAQGTGSGSILRRNFQALKNAIPALDAINDDDEATYDANATTQFAVMLADIGFKYTLAPYQQAAHWQGVVNSVNSQRPGTLDRIYLQCYDGGAGNNPCDWNFGVPLYAGKWDYDSNADIQTDLTNWKNSCGIVGGFMWFERTANTDRMNYANIINPIFGYSCRPPASTGLVTIYEDLNFTGYSNGFGTGDYNLATLKSMGMADNTLTSLQVAEGYKAILYFDDNFTGNSVTITADQGWIGSTFNDQVTSLRVLPNGNPNLAGTYYIKNSVSSWFVDLANADATNGTQIRQWDYNGSDAQKFNLVHLGDGNYSIISASSGKVWDVNGISQDAGALIQEWDNVNGKNQHFILVDAGNGLFKMIAEHSGKVAEVSTNNHGEQLHQWWNAGQANSFWILVPIDQTIGMGTGLRANYFNGQNFETPVYTNLDATIDFDWGNGSPNAAVNIDSFTARWTGQVQAKSTTEYTFYINSDNGRRLWVNKQLIIDSWVDDVNEYSGKITLTAGQKYDITIEYFEDLGGAAAHLSWSTAVSGKEIIPTTQLYPNALPTVSLVTPTNNQVYYMPAPVAISANAADTDGSVVKVEFYNGTTKLGEKTASPFSYSWTNTPAGSYTITARVYDNKGAVTISPPVNVKVNIVTGVNDTQLTSGLSIYPNPAENTLYVNGLKDADTAGINIFDLQGKWVLSPAGKQSEIAIDALPQGFYIIEVTDGGQKLVEKFVKK